jgi:fluoride ion exporter CrcB/FEX
VAQAFSPLSVVIFDPNRIVPKTLIAICLGARFGAVMRRASGIKPDSPFPDRPPGTLAANLVGGYLFGVANAMHEIGSVRMTPLGFGSFARIAATR